jgi:hypothetical protein
LIPLANKPIVRQLSNERINMNRKLKVLGLALVAILAMSAMVASAASAASFTSSQAKTTIVGEQVVANTFTVNGQTVTCKTTTFHGETLATQVESVTVTPTYTNCTAFGFAEAKVTGFGHYGEASKCDYKLYASGKADLVCPAGTEIVVEAGTCKTHIKNQTGLGTVTYTTGTNLGVHDLTLDLNLTGIHAVTTGGFLCPLGGTGHTTTFTNATLTGTVTASGKDPVTLNPVSITHDTP